MMRFVRRLAAGAAVVVSMSAAMVVTPGVSSAQCDPNWSHIVATNECKPPPPPPSWYTPPPPYAPMYAPPDVPPPPQTPPPSPWPVHPVWDGGRQQWVWIGI
ncbi:hypothetical protein [Mycobacterium celatum]|uniref:Secreted protein n=1 Tax=Mycobacterium celatum TaxID=28045 RepID=A0A2G5PQM5_MYCCE|nr:hypothetical protein [Mycobacterium celatum]PIB80611.1 hypothetical protein CQY23_03500 [Mycobacterium celatum]